MRKLNFDFQIKKESGSGGIFIEGYANAATVDRSGELIDPKGWKLENYKKNPVILFDHGLDPSFGSLPIGKAVFIESRDGGLFAKVKISDSKTEKITAIRDLVEEGMLKTFSVGFRSDDSEQNNDSKVLKNSELLEISIVPVPMNQDSTFAILNLNLSENRSKLAKKWLKRYKAEAAKSIIDTSKKENNCDKLELLSISVDKSGYENLEKASKFLKNLGYAVDDFTESDKTFLFKQQKISDDKNSFEVEISPGIKAIVKGKNMKTKSDTEDKGCDKDPKEKAMSDFMGEFRGECESTLTEAKPDWVGDEEAWRKAKEAALEYKEDPEKYYAMVTWLYINKFGGTIKSKEEEEKVIDEEEKPMGDEKPTEDEKPMEDEEKIKALGEAPPAPIPTGSPAMGGVENPSIDLQKQTNVLLGALISEIQKMSEMIQKLVVVEEKPNDYMEPPSSELEQAEELQLQKAMDEEKIQKAIDSVRSNILDLRRDLKLFK